MGDRYRNIRRAGKLSEVGCGKLPEGSAVQGLKMPCSRLAEAFADEANGVQGRQIQETQYGPQHVLRQLAQPIHPTRDVEKVIDNPLTDEVCACACTCVERV